MKELAVGIAGEQQHRAGRPTADRCEQAMFSHRKCSAEQARVERIISLLA